MTISSARRIMLVTLAAGALTAAGLTAAITAASAATCSDVDITFARGSGELAGLGSVGAPFASAGASHGGALVVSGDPGTGKTALLDRARLLLHAAGPPAVSAGTRAQALVLRGEIELQAGSATVA